MASRLAYGIALLFAVGSAQAIKIEEISSPVLVDLSQPHLSYAHVRIEFEDKASVFDPISVQVGGREYTTPGDSESITVDLREVYAGGLTKNTKVNVTVRQGASSDSGSMYMSMPVVLVSGIQPTGDANAQNGDGVFGTFHFRLILRVGEETGGESEWGHTPHLVYAKYPVNTATFAQGALGIRDALQEISNSSAFKNVILVSHSKGGLVTRKFLQNNGPSYAGVTITNAVLAQTPHMGSEWGSLSQMGTFVYSTTGYFGVYANLNALWSTTWINGSPTLPPLANGELLALNGMLPASNDPPCPSSVKLHLLYSRSESTKVANDIQELPPIYTAFGDVVDMPVLQIRAAGDWIVPAFSQLGRVFTNGDPNAISTMPRAPNLVGANIIEREFPGKHFNVPLGDFQGIPIVGEYIAQQEIVEYVFDLMKQGS